MHGVSKPAPGRAAVRAERRRRRRKRIRCAAAALCVLTLVGGFVWGGVWLRLGTENEPVEPVAPGQRAQAIALLDRAVTARHGELADEAVRLASDAREQDPTVPGAALFLAEMAFRRGAIEDSSAAALEALRQDEYAGDARLLLALNTWMRREQTGAEEAGRSSTQMLAEAAEAELANSQVRFFAGDLLRIIGKPAEAQASLIGSLHRQQPWDSAALLAAKLRLALEEAGPKAQGRAALGEDDRFGAGAVQMQRVIRERGDATPPLVALQSVFTAKQMALLTYDSALSGFTTPAARPTVEKLSPPFAEAASSKEEVGALPQDAWKKDVNYLDTNDFRFIQDLRSRE